MYTTWTIKYVDFAMAGSAIDQVKPTRAESVMKESAWAEPASTIKMHTVIL